MEAAIDADEEGNDCGACGCDIPSDMICIPEGPFLMGTEDQYYSDAPLHEVFLSGFLIDRYEVSNISYKQCVTDEECTDPAAFDSPSRSGYYFLETYDEYPVIFVDWYGADQYCRWAGKRLPTEAEWEKAARGGCEMHSLFDCEESFDLPSYPWGEEDPRCELANLMFSCFGDTEEVYSHPGGASPYGVMNMSGNVGEWVSDWYDPEYYEYSPRLDPQGPGESDGPWPCAETTFGYCRVLRGDGYNVLDAARGQGTVFRRWQSQPANYFPSQSFRCARDVEY